MEEQYNVSGAKHETHFRNDQVALHNAEAAALADKDMTLGQVLSRYKKAVFWSMVLSTALIMEGYDVAIINSFWGQNAFLQKFGKIGPDGKRFVPANWQAAINNAASIGQIIGIMINGVCQAQFGSKRTYLVAMVVMVLTIFLAVFATSLEMVFGAEIAMGIPWGVFQTLTTAYAAEICPIGLRGYLTSWVNCCWGIGLTIGAGVVRASLSIEGDWGWRMPYAVQWVWPIPLILAVSFAPESPWWLVRKGRAEDAKKALRRLGAESYLTEERVEATYALIAHTIELEEAETAGSGWRELFVGTNKIRTEIPISNYASSFLQQAGMNEKGAFDLNIANYCMILAGTLISWAFFYRFGRRALYIYGLASQGLLFLIIGIIGSLPRSNAHALGIGIVMIMITFAFGLSVAPACYSIVAEIPSSRVRAQAVALARAVYILSQGALNQLFPRFLTPRPDGWDIGGKCGYLFVGLNALLCTYCFFRLPETMGRSFGEIDIMFQNKVAPRKFKYTKVDQFQADRVEDFEKEKSAVQHVE